MGRFALGAWTCILGVALLMYPALRLLDSFGDGRRTTEILFFENWFVTFPGILLLVVGNRLMAGARLRD